MQILIVDLGSQYTRLIGRTLRDLGVRSLILPPDKAEAWLAGHRGEVKGVILSGGAASITEEDLPPLIMPRGIPVLGICLGMHWMARDLGGLVESPQTQRGYGPEEIEVLAADNPLFRRVPRFRSTVWMSHGDSVTKMPPGFCLIARGERSEVAAMSSDDRTRFAVQFHPEVIETQYGTQMLAGFLDVCGTRQDWGPTDIVAQIREEVARAVGPDDRALLAFSGGVDSSTLTAVVGPVLGDRLACVALAHGGLRAGEEVEIIKNAAAVGCGHPGAPSISLIECQNTFLDIMPTVGIDPEVKRKSFRNLYRLQLEALAERHRATILIQGTLAPDVIESGKSGGAATIVTHHNVGMETTLQQVHPLANLFKYEVRELARHLNLPPSVSERKPFPGPGLYCRIVGTPVTPELLDVVRWADVEVHRVVREAGIEDEFDQLVVALLGSKIAGIKGDGRAHEYPIGVRAVRTTDFMTCYGYQFPPRPDNPAPVRKRIERALVTHPKIICPLFDESDKPPRRTEFE